MSAHRQTTEAFPAKSQLEQLQTILRPLLLFVVCSFSGGVLAALTLIWALAVVPAGEIAVVTALPAGLLCVALVLRRWGSAAAGDALNPDLLLFLFRSPHFFPAPDGPALRQSARTRQPFQPGSPQQVVGLFGKAVDGNAAFKLGIWCGILPVIFLLDQSLLRLAVGFIWAMLCLAVFRILLEVRKQLGESGSLLSIDTQAAGLFSLQSPSLTNSRTTKNFKRHYWRICRMFRLRKKNLDRLVIFFQLLVIAEVVVIVIAVSGAGGWQSGQSWPFQQLADTRVWLTVAVMAVVCLVTVVALPVLPAVAAGIEAYRSLAASAVHAREPVAWSGIDDRTVIADNLGFMSGRRRLLDGLSFHLDRGEILGLVGGDAENTRLLLLQLATAAFAYTGSLTFDGIELSAWDQSIYQSCVGFYDPQTMLLGSTVYEAVTQFSPTVEQGRLNTALHLSGLEPLLSRGVLAMTSSIRGMSGLLSPGVMARIRLAGIIYQQPKLVVMDDPSASLDVTGVHSLRTVLAYFREQAVPVIYASRARSFLKLCDKIVLISKNRIVFYGGYSQLPD